MARGCADCGYRGHAAALDFDHLPGSVKLFDIGGSVAKYSLEVLLAEVTKCEVVCANCHRVRTFVRKQAEIATYRPNEAEPPYVRTPRGRTHGRVGTYNSGCRCDECRAASAAARRRYPRRAATSVPPLSEAR